MLCYAMRMQSCAALQRSRFLEVRAVVFQATALALGLHTGAAPGTTPATAPGATASAVQRDGGGRGRRQQQAESDAQRRPPMQGQGDDVPGAVVAEGTAGRGPVIMGP